MDLFRVFQRLATLLNMLRICNRLVKVKLSLYTHQYDLCGELRLNSRLQTSARYDGGQLHALAALPRRKNPPFPTGQGTGWTPTPLDGFEIRKISCFCRKTNSDSTVVQPTAYGPHRQQAWLTNRFVLYIPTLCNKSFYLLQMNPRSMWYGKAQRTRPENMGCI